MTISENTNALVETRNCLKYQIPDVEVKLLSECWNTHLYIFEDSFSPCIEETKTRSHVGIPHRMRLMETSSEVFPNPTHTHTLHDLNVKTLSAEPLLHRTHSNYVFLSDPRPIIGHPCQCLTPSLIV